MDKTWKRHERLVAEKLGTRRIPNNGTGQPDMVVDLGSGLLLAVEHKSRGNNPVWYLDALRQSKSNAGGKLPLVVHTFYEQRENVQVASMYLNDFIELLEIVREYNDLRSS